MAVVQENKRPRFEEDANESIASFIQALPDSSDLNLPPLVPKSERQEESEPRKIIGAALEERPVEAVLDADASFGPVVIPKEDSLWDYKYLLSEGTGTCNIRFSPKIYAVFDGIIVRECGLDSNGQSLHPGFSEEHKRYNHYAPLRRNLAILRNYLMVTYPLGADAGKTNLALLKLMASKLGEALREEAHKPGFIERIKLAIRKMMGRELPAAKFNRFLELANTPDRGIAFMYHYLCGLMAMSLVPGTLSSAGELPKDWRLLPLEQTPFSSDNMLLYSDAARMSRIADAFEVIVEHLRSVDDMHERDKEISVEHARDILKNMRIIATGMREEKEYDVLDPRTREAHSMLQAALCFQGSLAEVAVNDPSLLDDPAMVDAIQVIGKVSQRVRAEEKNMAREEYRPEPEQKPQTPSKTKSRPSYSKQRIREPIAQILHKFEEGINRVGEIRKKSMVARMKQKSMVSQALGKGALVQQTLKDGQSTMSSPKIHQVSLSDPEFIQTVKQMNEPPAKEPQKDAAGEQSITGGGRR